MTAPMGPEQDALRKAVLDEMVRYVAAGADVAVVRTLLTQGVSASEEVADMAASALPGRWEVAGETWEGADYFTARAIYVADTTVCVVSGGASIGDEVVEVDAVWLERAEFRAMAVAEEGRCAGCGKVPSFPHVCGGGGA